MGSTLTGVPGAPQDRKISCARARSRERGLAYQEPRRRLLMGIDEGIMKKARQGLKWPEPYVADRPWFNTDDLTSESEPCGDEIQQLQNLCLQLAAIGGAVRDDDGAETPEPALIAA